MMDSRRFQGQLERLRSPQRLAMLEVARVVELCLAGGAVRSVSDVGVGSAVFAEAFAAAGLTVAGVDINPDMLPVARQCVPAGDFREAPAEKLPFPDQSFDLVYLGHVLHEVDDPLKTLQEAHRVARQRVVVLEWPYRAEEMGPPLEHRLQPATVLQWAAAAGFQPVESIPLTHMALFRFSRPA